MNLPVTAFRSKGKNPVTLKTALHGQPIPQVTVHKHLGVTFNDTLTWGDHTDAVCSKASQRIGLLRRYSMRLPSLSIRHLSFYCTAIRPDLEYASTVWYGLSSTACMRSPGKSPRTSIAANMQLSSDTRHDILLALVGLQPLRTRRLSFLL